MVTVHRLIYDVLLEGLRVLGDVEDSVDVAFEVAVVVVEHGGRYSVFIELLPYFERMYLLNSGSSQYT